MLEKTVKNNLADFLCDITVGARKIDTLSNKLKQNNYACRIISTYIMKNITNKTEI